MAQTPQASGRWNVLLSYGVLAVFIAGTLLVTYLLYAQVQGMFKERLRERIRSIAATASIQFDAAELDLITGPESVGTEIYKRNVRKLQRIREINGDIKYAYVWRRTKDPNTVVFIADADSIDPYAKIDLNEDGVIDDADALNVPGDSYDISEYAYLKDGAFEHPTVDPELTVDQWSTFLSATAPIFNTQGTADEVVGVDVDVTDFVRITNLALVPFVLFVLFLLAVLMTQTIILVRMWGSQVRLLGELDRQKDELLSIVSHQLATPIASVKWYLEMLMDGDLGQVTKEQKEHIATMQGVTVNLSDLVSMILDVSRIQLGKMKIEKQELDLNSFFKEILDVIEPKAKEKGVQFNVKMPLSLPKAMLDNRYTRMTVENLLSNAIKYTPKDGHVDFLVELHGQRLYCEVKDTGCGIPKADQDKIFGKLFRASNVRNAIDGNGFGLFVAKGAIEAQGGKIWFESPPSAPHGATGGREEGKGTTFFIDIPLKGGK